MSEESFDDMVNLTKVCANSSFGLKQFTLEIFNISLPDILNMCTVFLIHIVDIIGQLNTVNEVFKDENIHPCRPIKLIQMWPAVFQHTWSPGQPKCFFAVFCSSSSSEFVCFMTKECLRQECLISVFFCVFGFYLNVWRAEWLFKSWFYCATLFCVNSCNLWCFLQTAVIEVDFTFCFFLAAHL